MAPSTHNRFDSITGLEDYGERPSPMKADTTTGWSISKQASKPLKSPAEKAKLTTTQRYAALEVEDSKLTATKKRNLRRKAAKKTGVSKQVKEEPASFDTATIPAPSTSSLPHEQTFQDSAGPEKVGCDLYPFIVLVVGLLALGLAVLVGSRVMLI